MLRYRSRTRLLERAIQLDPRFAVAKVALAYRTIFRGYTEGPQTVDRGIVLARDAAEIDPMLAAAHETLGTGYVLKGMDAQARLAFLRALELDPNSVTAMHNLSINEVQYGRLDDALMWVRRSFGLSARTGNDYYHVCVPLVLLRDDEVTWRWLSQAERRDPQSSRVQTHLAYTEMLRGDVAAALSRLRRAWASARPQSWPPRFIVSRPGNQIVHP
jgi:tetratricopeptide (TPR) repeat protein